MENLFSYGTLQLEKVQVETFGRKLLGQLDRLVGYKLESITITDPKVIETSGMTEHPLLVYTGNSQDFVEGTVFEITLKELQQADLYEVDDYKRIETVTKSGKKTWVYVSAT